MGHVCRKRKRMEAYTMQLEHENALLRQRVRDLKQKLGEPEDNKQQTVLTEQLESCLRDLEGPTRPPPRLAERSPAEGWQKSGRHYMTTTQ